MDSPQVDTSTLLPVLLLNQILPHMNEDVEKLLPDRSQRPVVTLTYAQSLDGKIAGVNGKQLILSGSESMMMTHWMRTMHDGILVGIGTAINDDPQLNTRRLPPRESDSYPQPTPIVIDTHLRLPTSCKLIQNYSAGKGKRPWVISGPQPDVGRKSELEAMGVKVLKVETNPINGRIDLAELLRKLHSEGIKSLMVEGGQQIISSFLREPSLIDTVIITVAPVLVGKDGVGAIGENENTPQLKHITSVILGPDAVVICKT